MKKFFSILLCFVLVCSLTGCVGNFRVTGEWTFSDEMIEVKSRYFYLPGPGDPEEKINELKSTFMVFKWNGVVETINSRGEVEVKEKYTMDGDILTIHHKDGSYNVYKVNGDEISNYLSGSVYFVRRNVDDSSDS